MGCLSAAKGIANRFFNADCGQGGSCPSIQVGRNAAGHHDLRLIPIAMQVRSQSIISVGPGALRGQLCLRCQLKRHGRVVTSVLGLAMLTDSGSIHKETSHQFFPSIRVIRKPTPSERRTRAAISSMERHEGMLTPSRYGAAMCTESGASFRGGGCYRRGDSDQRLTPSRLPRSRFLRAFTAIPSPAARMATLADLSYGIHLHP